MAAPMLALPAASEDRGRYLAATRLGVLLYAVAMAMVEVGLVGAYLAVRHSSPKFTPGAYHENNYQATMITLAMLLAAVTVEWFVWGVRARERRQAMVAAGLSALFGVCFLNGLTYLLRTSHIGPGNSPFAALFWSFLVFNAVLTVVGLGALFVAVLRVQGGQASMAEPHTVRAAGWLWQLAVVCWLVTWFYVFFLYKN
jgi:heme/copper-type cytochrome/quinol oxidase subunit 3